MNKIVYKYLDTYIPEGIKEENLNKILDLIDEYIELKEGVLKKWQIS